MYILACCLGVNAKIALKYKVVCEGNFNKTSHGDNDDCPCVVLKDKNGNCVIYKKEYFLQNFAKYVPQKRNVTIKKQEDNQTEELINLIRIMQEKNENE